MGDMAGPFVVPPTLTCDQGEHKAGAPRKMVPLSCALTVLGRHVNGGGRRRQSEAVAPSRSDRGATRTPGMRAHDMACRPTCTTHVHPTFRVLCVRMWDGVRRVAYERWGVQGSYTWDGAPGRTHTLPQEPTPFAPSHLLANRSVMGEAKRVQNRCPHAPPFPHRGKPRGLAGVSEGKFMHTVMAKNSDNLG